MTFATRIRFDEERYVVYRVGSHEHADLAGCILSDKFTTHRGARGCIISGSPVQSCSAFVNRNGQDLLLDEAREATRLGAGLPPVYACGCTSLRFFSAFLGLLCFGRARRPPPSFAVEVMAVTPRESNEIEAEIEAGMAQWGREPD